MQSSAFWPDATSAELGHSLRDMDVSILIRCRMQPGGVRCQRFVSILIRPSGRMQPLPSWATPCVIWMFQSSSGQKAGCNRPVLLPKCFNPHPAFWPDATSSGQKAGCFNPHPVTGCNLPAAVVVSILIRPSGRMQQCSCHSRYQRCTPVPRFNPHPAFWPDATVGVVRYSLGSSARFNPHPAFWPDATIRWYYYHAKAGCNRFFVSILIRLQKAGCNTGCHGIAVFVSILTAGARWWPCWFQSSSGQKAGCNYPPVTAYRLGGHPVSILIRPSGRMQQVLAVNPGFAHAFQSSSGLLAGCNSPRCQCARLPVPVSILIRPEGRMQHPMVLLEWIGLMRVSILIRPSGRMQLFQQAVKVEVVKVSILIRPEGRMQPVPPCP